MVGRYLQINRLRIMRRGHSAYDQNFHPGVNIIRGENGSGKSTISDFIFFVLGGEFDDWKEAASQCDEVQAEIETSNGKLVLKRATSSAQQPVSVFFGGFEDASKSALDRWETFPLRRLGSRESFSQVMFRTLGIPEARGRWRGSQRRKLQGSTRGESHPSTLTRARPCSSRLAKACKPCRSGKSSR